VHVLVSIESWVHCNDSTMTLCSRDDVHRAQAYILVYSRVWPTPAAESDEGEMQCDDDESDDDSNILYSLVQKSRSACSSS